MNLFELVAKLTLDSSEYDRALMAAKGTTVKAGDSMVASIGKTKKAIGVAALGMGAAIGAFGVSSVKTGMEFDSAMSQVAATMGKTMDDLANETGEVDLAWGKFSGNLRDYAKEMGEHTKFSAIESAEALNYMALAGYDTQKSMEMLPPVLSLAAAGNMELARASDMVTDASSALGLSQEETLSMVDQMAMAASKSNTSVEQLGDAILRVGGTAKVMKGGTTELSTVLGLLADNGTKGAEAGTAMRNILMAIQGDKFEKTFGEMGISAYDAQGNLRSLKDIFMDMQTAMDGMTDEQRTDIISKTFNARDLKNVNALLGTSAERWDQLTGAISDSEGAAEKMSETQLDNLAGDITLLQSAFEGLKISISDKLTPAFRGVVQFLTWCIDHASVLGPIILGLATAFGVFAVAINIGTIIKTVTTAIAALNAVLLANPIGIVVALISGLAVALIALWKNNEDFRNKVLEIWGAIRDAVTGAVEAIVEFVKPVWDALKSVITDAMESIKSTVVPIWDAIKTTFMAIVDVISGYVAPVWEKLKAIISAALPVIKTIIQTNFMVILAIVKGVFSAIATVITTVWNILSPIISTALKAIGAIFKFWFALFFTIVSTVFNNIKNIINLVMRAVAPVVKAAVAKIKSAFATLSTIVGRVRSSFNSVKNAIVTPIKDAYNKVKGWINKIKKIFPLKVGKIFSNLKIPKITVNGGKAPFGIGGSGTAPKISVRWNKKAEQVPYLFTNATLFGAGEHNDEVLYGRTALMNDIREAVGGGGGNVEVLAEMIGEIVGARVADALDGMDIVLDRRSFGKMTRRMVGV